MCNNVVEFTKDMKDEYTILVPNMLPIHFSMLKNVFRAHGYNMVVLQNEGPDVVNEGLKLVHNDTCYPALLVIGQLIDALKSGNYDINKTALMITQTGGGCRASNYIYLLRKALVKAGYENVPVISLNASNASGLEKNSGFNYTIPMLRQSLAVVAYGFLMYCVENGVIDTALYGGGYIKSKVRAKLNEYLGKLESAIINSISQYEGFVAPTGFKHIKTLGEKVIGLGTKMGEGWLLPAEIMELIQIGYENIICTQPFGCLPNHIIGKGIIRKVKKIHENANIVSIDYDPGATKVNQENRIKLMLSVAKENLQTKMLYVSASYSE